MICQGQRKHNIFLHHGSLKGIPHVPGRRFGVELKTCTTGGRTLAPALSASSEQRRVLGESASHAITATVAAAGNFAYPPFFAPEIWHHLRTQTLKTFQNSSLPRCPIFRRARWSEPALFGSLVIIGPEVGVRKKLDLFYPFSKKPITTEPRSPVCEQGSLIIALTS